MATLAGMVLCPLPSRTLRMGRRTGWRIFFNQFVAVALPFFFCRLLAKQRETLQQVWNLGFVACLPESLDQMIQRCLVLRIENQRLPALFDGFLVLTGLQVKLRQHTARSTQRRF